MAEIEIEKLKDLIKSVVRTELDGTEFKIEQPIEPHTHKPTEELDSCPECHKHTLKPNGKYKFVCIGENCGNHFETCPNGDCKTLLNVSKPKKYQYEDYDQYFCPECDVELDMSDHVEEED